MNVETQLFVIQQKFPNSFVVEVTETQWEFGVTTYQPSVYIKTLLFKNFDNKDKKLFKEDGIAPFLDCEGVFTDDHLERAIQDLYFYLMDRGYFYDNQ